MNQTADVVVVGGGVIGCFIAYELSKAGFEVVVVEKSQVLWIVSCGFKSETEGSWNRTILIHRCPPLR